MSSGRTVDILMATHQGESWVDVQIATIVAQDYCNWRLLVRDDGSTDRTLERVKFWRDRFPDRIFLLDEHDPKNLGLTENFTVLLKASSAPYVMFASWDDVWYRDKVSTAVKAIQRLEAQHGVDSPLLVHTDLRVVDSNLHELHPSALKQIGCVAHRRRTIGRFCLENTVFGCALIANRSLAQRATPIPKDAGCEDYWIALVAAAFGIIEARRETSLDWRRHGVNHSLVTNSLLGSLQSLLADPFAHRRKLLDSLQLNRKVVVSFLERFETSLSEKDLATVRAFLALPTSGFWMRRKAILQHQIFYSSWIRTAGLLMLI